MIKRVKKNNITGIRKQWLQTEHTLLLSDLAPFQPLVTFHYQLAATNFSRSEHHLGNGLWSKSTTGQTSSLTSGTLTTSDTETVTGGLTWVHQNHTNFLEKEGSVRVPQPETPCRRCRPPPRPALPNCHSGRDSFPPHPGKDGRPFQ